MDKILIIIPCMNLWDRYTIHAMESIYASITDLPYEVLIVDNNSTDDTSNKAEDFGNRKLPGRMHIIRTEQNVGCAGGWNRGVQWGMDNGFNYFIIANNDILVAPNMIQALYDRAKRGDKVLISAVDVAKEVMIPQEVLDPTHPVNNKPDTESPHPSFSCFLITRECVEKVGYFDEEFYPAYFEDNDYHYRIKIGVGPEAAIANTTAIYYHYGSRTQNQNPGNAVVSGEKFERNREYFTRKWGNVPGRETFINPFNDKSKDHTYAKHTN